MPTSIATIDFGTSFTAAAIGRDGAARLVDFGSGARFPSGVIAGEKENTLTAGHSAYIARKRTPNLFVRTPKRLIDQPDYLLGTRLVTVPAIIEAVLEHALREVKRILVDPPTELRLTHPAVWSDTRKDLLLEAGRHALATLGWRDVAVQSLAEPVAAAVEAANENPVAPGSVLAIYDLGGGTFDAALVRRTESGFQIVGAFNGLDPCGGEDFDEQIFGLIGRSVRDRAEVTAQLFNVTDDESDDARKSRLAFSLNLREEIVSAKEALSDSMQADVDLPRPLDGRAAVTRQQFEGLIEEDVMRTVRTLQDTVQGAIDGKHMTADELVGIVLTGGSSRIPMVERVVKEKFGLQIFTQPDRKGTVALGAVRWKPEERVATPRRVENRKESGTFESQPPVEFRSRLGVKVDSNWRHREIRIVVGNENLVVNGYPSSLKDNHQWANSVRKTAAPNIAVGKVLPARVAGVEEGLQLWRLQTHDDGSATKYLERFALQRVNGGVRAAHIVAREGSDALVNHVRIGDPLLSSTEYEHTPFVLRVPAGTQVWERTTIVPKRKLGSKAPFDVAAESTDLAPGVTPEEWNTRVLARFSAEALASLAHEQDSFLEGRPAIRSIVKLKAPVGPARVTWGCWWTGIVDGRGLAIAVEASSPVSLDKAARYRDLFVLGTHA